MNLFTQQGWQCPCCSRIYSPTTSMCFTCPTKVKTAPNTSPPQRQPLTVEQIEMLMDTYDVASIDYARAIEAAHGIKKED